MVDYEHYRRGRDAAWMVLLETGARELPVNLREICRVENIRLLTYSEAGELLGALLSDEQGRTDGISFRFEGQDVILYDDTVEEGRQRYTIAHEIGHCMLEHLTAERETTPEQWQEMEAQAERFAVQLLALACVLWGIGVQDAEAVRRFCGLSRTASERRMERLRALYQREAEWLSRNRGSCFLQHPMERAVYEQFSQFIRSVREEES